MSSTGIMLAATGGKRSRRKKSTLIITQNSQRVLGISMSMLYTKTDIEGVVRITLPNFKDDRGFFLEAYHARKFADAGINTMFIQDNQSRSRKGVIRGLHFQWNPPLGKLIRVAYGKAFLAFVDIRPMSPSFRVVVTEQCESEHGTAFYVPPGIATGFCALQDGTDILYKYTAYYNKDGEGNIRFNDPELSISWPVTAPIISERDENAPTLAKWLERPESRLW